MTFIANAKIKTKVYPESVEKAIVIMDFKHNKRNKKRKIRIKMRIRI